MPTIRITYEDGTSEDILGAVQVDISMSAAHQYQRNGRNIRSIAFDLDAEVRARLEIVPVGATLANQVWSVPFAPGNDGPLVTSLSVSGTRAVADLWIPAGTQSTYITQFLIPATNDTMDVKVFR